MTGFGWVKRIFCPNTCNGTYILGRYDQYKRKNDLSISEFLASVNSLTLSVPCQCHLDCFFETSLNSYNPRLNVHLEVASEFKLPSQEERIQENYNTPLEHTPGNPTREL